MSIERTLEQYAEAKGRRDVEAALALCTEDCTYESVGLGAPVRGKEALRSFYGALFDALPDYHGDFDGAAYGDDVAVVWGRWGGTVAGDFLGLGAVPGRRLDVPVTFVCRFRDGLLASDTGYFDIATLCDQAGIPLGALRPAPGDDFARRFAEFWRAPDAALVPALVHEDVVARMPGSDEVVDGLADYQARIAAFLSLAPDLTLDVVDHLAQGDRVMIQWQAHGTVGGRPLTLEGVDRFVLRDGKVSEGLVVFDTGVLQSALAQPA